MHETLAQFRGVSKTALDIRAKYALSKVIAGVDSETGADLAVDALEDAQVLGHNTVGAEINEPPVLFLDEPWLVDAWRNGIGDRDQVTALLACSGCNDGTGKPCALHG